MSRAHQLRSALDRARDRERQAYRKFTSFAAGCDSGDTKQRTRRRDLQHSWEQCQREVQDLLRDIERALDVEGVNL